MIHVLIRRRGRYKETLWGDTETQGQYHLRIEVQIVECVCLPRIGKDCLIITRHWEKARDRVSLRVHTGNQPCRRPSSLQSCEKILILPS